MTDDDWDECETMPRRRRSGIAKASDAPDEPSRGPLHDEMFEKLRIAGRDPIVLDTPATERVVLVFHSVERRFGERERLVALRLNPQSPPSTATRGRAGGSPRSCSRTGARGGRIGRLVLLGRGGAVDYLSSPACLLVERWFGGLEGGRLPSELADWLRSPRPRSPLELARDGHRLAVESRPTRPSSSPRKPLLPSR